MNNVQISTEGFQLSPQQKSVWRSQQLVPAFSFRVQGSILIKGRLDINRFHQALQQVVDRHEILRTRFVCLPGMTIPLQAIHDQKRVTIVESDFSRLSPSEQVTQIDLQWQKLAQQRFDFEQGSILLAALITLSGEQHLLLLNVSALNADSATFVNLVAEISDAYSTNGHKQESMLEPMQYADIAQWQNELLESSEPQAGREFWRKLTTPLEMPTLALAHKKAAMEFDPECLNVEINHLLAQKLTALAQAHTVPVSTVLLTCWLMFIGRFKQLARFTIGLTANGRNYQDLETALGLLSKTLPLTVSLDNDLTFSQMLQQVHQSVQEVEHWQEAFEWKAFFQEQAQTIDGFPICFEVQTLPKSEQTDLTWSIQNLRNYIEPFQLKLFCLQQTDSLSVELYYDANLFHQADIQRLSEHFATLLDSVVTDSNCPIAQFNLLTDRHRHQLLVDFNQTQIDFSQSLCIHQRFEAQADQTPDQIAIVFEDQQLTYRELNHRANQLAHHLQKLGVKPEVLVGIYCDRSLDFIVALLGVLKAGGAYLPLDPALPSERLTQLLQTAQVTLVLTQQPLMDRVNGFTTVCLDDQSFDQDSQNCMSQTTIEHLAYVIYTSGSTGVPKGVAIEHRQLLNYLDGILPQLALPNNANFAIVSTFAADLGHTAIFPALCTGGCLHIISQSRSLDSEALSHYCRSHPIDCLKIVPSHLSALLNGADPAAILPRHCLVLGGEALSWELVQKVQQLSPHCCILNHYGPTETTVGVLTYPVESEPSACLSATVPIGRPLANTQTYILDSHLQPVPIGAVGELYIGGDGLARGYLNSPELTAQKFIHLSISTAKMRLYQTGDLARYLPDGTIEFLGRTDDQVKIRGFRVELGEIEAVLKQYPAIVEAVVVARKDASGELRLAAYILPNLEISTSELQNWLNTKLPDYMIPSGFVQLKTLPLTANGKLDRSALPIPDFTHTTEFVAPRTPIEQTLAEIWADVLQLEQVGVNDNFFELGGHSLLATQVVSRLRQALLVELPLHHLFESPTVADLAVVVDQQLAHTDEAMLAALEELSEADAQTALIEGVFS